MQRSGKFMDRTGLSLNFSGRSAPEKTAHLKPWTGLISECTLKQSFGMILLIHFHKISFLISYTIRTNILRLKVNVIIVDTKLECIRMLGVSISLVIDN